MARNYVSFDARNGYPASAAMFYECLTCGNILPSLPSDSTMCACRNIRIDTGYGRVVVENDSQMRVFTTDTPQ